MHATRLLTGFASAVVLLAPVATHAFEVPPNDGFYTETFEVLTDEQEAQLEQLLTEYQRTTSNEIAILVVDSMSGADINEAGTEVGNKWKVGAEGKDNGIVMLAALADTDREMTIQVGYGLEGVVPDIVAAGIIQKDMAPQFRKGKYAEGFAAGIDALKKHIGGEYTADRYLETDGGGLAQFGFVFFLLLVNFFGAYLGRSRSWWMGGVLGGVGGVVLTLLFGWWVAIPMFVLLGLGFDYLVSKHPPRGGRGGYWGGGGFGGGRGGGGGFGGFGGGSFGGGGARGKW